MIEPVLHFGRDEYARRLARTRAAMEAAGIEILVVTDASNMAWLSGYDGWSFYTPQAVVVAGEGEPVWWGRGMDAAGALRTCWMREENLLGFADTYVHARDRHAMQDLAVRIAERGWGKARIGVEMDNWWLPAAAFAALQRGLPEARFEDATGLVNWQRAVKSEAEIGHMKTAGGSSSGCMRASSRWRSRASGSATSRRRSGTRRSATTRGSVRAATIRRSCR
jgi:ectoine hydrolase